MPKITQIVFWIMLLLVAVLLPIASGANESLLMSLIFMLIFIIYASAWNFLATSGQGSLGHAAFFGLGGYGFAVAAGLFGVPPLAALLVGGFFSALVGVLIGVTCIRMREWFLAMVTFGFSIIIETIVVELSAVDGVVLTGGHDGLQAAALIPISVPGYRMWEYYMLLFFAAAVVGVFYALKKSKMGLALEAIRENELEAKVMGVDVVKNKLVAFAVSAFFSGFAGALFAQHIRYITPELFRADNSFWPIIYSISGGLSSIGGPIVGTIVVKSLWDVLPQFGLNYERYVLIGGILVLTVIFLPKGFVSLPEKLWSLVQRLWSFLQRPK